MSRLFERIACALRWVNHVETVKMDMLALFGADQMLKLGGVEGPSPCAPPTVGSDNWQRPRAFHAAFA